jgi:ABC-type glycerol-3-phosphate transport system permease component
MNNKTVLNSNVKMTVAARILMIISTVIVIYPLFFMLTTSLKSNKEFFTNLFWLPQHIEWSNYANAWNTGHISQYFLNSAIVTVASVILTVVVALLGGYALAKMYIPKAETIIMAFMTFTFIPGIAIYISLYIEMTKMHLTNNYFTLILPYTAWQIPFSMYIFKKFIETVPMDIIESSRIDGCSELRAFLSIVLPLVTPAIATVIVFTFIGNWGELMWANITTASAVHIKTLPVGLLNFKTDMGVNWGQYSAGICIVTLPLMIVFGYFQKYFVAGLTNGAVKG